MTTETAAVAEPTIEERRAWARDAIHRFLGHATGNAQEMVTTLNDEEVIAINLAAVSQTPRDGIKDVFTANYERRRKVHEQEAVADQRRLSQRAAATKSLIGVGMSDDEAREAVSHLTEGEQSILATIASGTDTGGIVMAVLDRAQARYRASLESAKPKEAEKAEVTGEHTGTTTTVGTDSGTMTIQEAAAEPAKPATDTAPPADASASDATPPDASVKPASNKKSGGK